MMQDEMDTAYYVWINKSFLFLLDALKGQCHKNFVLTETVGF